MKNFKGSFRNLEKNVRITTTFIKFRNEFRDNLTDDTCKDLKAEWERYPRDLVPPEIINQMNSEI